MAHQFSDDERKRLAKQGKAMSDGGYPIRNREDLVNAVRAYGRGNNKEEVKKWIKKRAKELDAEQYLPDNWRTDDTVVHQGIDEEVCEMPYYNDYLAHHGVKGMKWGVRRKRDEHNKSYTDKQRKNDRAMYGNRAEKRINRKLNEGYGLRGARHFEVERKERAEKRKKTARKVRRAVTGAAITAGSMVVSDMLFNNGMGTRAAVNFGKAAVRTGMNMVNNMKNARYNQAEIPLRPWEFKVD